jgi:hypothetical protein
VATFERSRIGAQLAEAGLIDWSRPYRDALIDDLDDLYVTWLGEGTVTVAAGFVAVSPANQGFTAKTSRSI